MWDLLGEWQKQDSKWGRRCGIACAVLVLVGVMLAVATRVGFDAAAKEWQAAVQVHYVTYLEKYEFTNEQKAVLDELIAHSQRDGLTVMAVAMSGEIVMETISDGEIDEEEWNMLQKAQVVLKEFPNPGILEFEKTIRQAHPNFVEYVKEFDEFD